MDLNLEVDGVMVCLLAETLTGDFLLTLRVSNSDGRALDKI